jgi:hypothetical protein
MNSVFAQSDRSAYETQRERINNYYLNEAADLDKTKSVRESEQKFLV